MNQIEDCPACGTSLNCHGCGEEIQNIIEQSTLLKEKDAEIIILKAKIKELEEELKSIHLEAAGELQ